MSKTVSFDFAKAVSGEFTAVIRITLERTLSRNDYGASDGELNRAYTLKGQVNSFTGSSSSVAFNYVVFRPAGGNIISFTDLTSSYSMGVSSTKYISSIGTDADLSTVTKSSTDSNFSRSAWESPYDRPTAAASAVSTVAGYSVTISYTVDGTYKTSSIILTAQSKTFESESYPAPSGYATRTFRLDPNRTYYKPNETVSLISGDANNGTQNKFAYSLCKAFNSGSPNWGDTPLFRYDSTTASGSATQSAKVPSNATPGSRIYFWGEVASYYRNSNNIWVKDYYNIGGNKYVNQPPVLTNTTQTTLFVPGSTITASVSLTHPDDQTVTYNWQYRVNNGSWSDVGQGWVSQGGLACSYTTTDSDAKVEFKVKANDGLEDSNEVTIEFNKDTGYVQVYTGGATPVTAQLYVFTTRSGAWEKADEVEVYDGNQWKKSQK